MVTLKSPILALPKKFLILRGPCVERLIIWLQKLWLPKATINPLIGGIAVITLLTPANRAVGGLWVSLSSKCFADSLPSGMEVLL